MERLTIDGLFCDIAQCRQADCTGVCDARRIYEKLRTLEALDEQKRLEIYPCKIGERIFEADGHTGKIFQRIAKKEDMLTKILPMWGDRYFATPEAAESALAGEKRCPHVKEVYEYDGDPEIMCGLSKGTYCHGSDALHCPLNTTDK